MDYTIISVNNRAIKNINKNKEYLQSSGFVFNEIDFVDGNNPNIDPFQELKNKNIDTSCWSPSDNRKLSMMPGEDGVWLSNIMIYEYVVKNKIKNFMFLEDDVVLHNNFNKNFYLFFNDLPKDYDFLSLFYFDGHNEDNELSEIGSSYIKKAINQKAGFQCMVVSLSGATKMLRHLKRYGTVYTNDCTVYYFGEQGMLNNYSKKKQTPRMVYHDTSVKSNVDPENKRNLDKTKHFN
jgi:GR25 family glycosyltransferase involved in LPS biosynthesis